MRYDGLETCWEQSKTYKKHFLDYLKYNNLQQRYNGCKTFDDLLARWADDDKLRFFSFYKILGTKPALSAYTDGVVSNKTLLRRLATNMWLVKKFPDEIDPLPERYEDWPSHFDIQAIHPIFSEEDRDIILHSIESCIERRQMFRDFCVKACYKQIDMKSHDAFLLVLQMMRARIIVFSV